jgi:lipoyl(octanoyl) transferase
MGVWRWLGRVPFAETVRQQELARARVLRGDGPETLLLCEHDPVVTLGRSANAANVLASPDDLARRGVELHAASRGGDVTYHGPGQLVGYPIVRLKGGVVDHVTAMARGIASVLLELGIDARWRRETPGLWVDDHTEDGNSASNSERGSSKICAFGVHDARLRVERQGRAGRLQSHRPVRPPRVAHDVDRRCARRLPIDPADARPRVANRGCART